MGEIKFMKTATFGGYDKNDVHERIEVLVSQNNALRNELSDVKMLKTSESISNDAENRLAESRELLTKLQTENDMLSLKLENSEKEREDYASKNAELAKEIEELNAKLDRANGMITALQQAGNDETAAFTNVMEQYRKAADNIIGDARSKAAAVKYDANKSAEDTVAQANKISEKIIRAAAIKASETVSAAESKAKEITGETQQQTSVVVQNADMDAFIKSFDILKNFIEGFVTNGRSAIMQSENLINEMNKAVAEAQNVKSEPVIEETVSEQKEIPHEETAETEQEEKTETQSPVKVKAVVSSNSDKPKKAKIDLASLAAKANAIGKKK